MPRVLVVHATDARVATIRRLCEMNKTAPDRPDKTLAPHSSLSLSFSRSGAHPRAQRRHALVDPAATVLPEPRMGVHELRRRRLRPLRGMVRARALHIAAVVFDFYLGQR